MKKDVEWVAVTADKYEMIIFSEPTASQLAKKLGVTTQSVITASNRNANGYRSGYRIVKIELEDTEDG